MTEKKEALQDVDDLHKLKKRLLKKIIIYLLIIVVALSFFIGVHRIGDNDMYPAFMDGDLVIIYKLGGFYTGDVVLYKVDGKTKCGRITAVEGDEVMITSDGQYSINNSIPYERIFYPTLPETGLSYPYKVENEEVFIMGDMRQRAVDSRTYGGIPLDDIKGKIVLLLFRGRGF